jgi:putative oxidoreductase
MAPERQVAGDDRRQGIRGLVERANSIVRAIAQPSLAQLVLRFGLAIPFWRSGVNKWDGFLQLNDVAVLLFSSEFKLHLPGGPYPFPAPEFIAFAVGSAEILLPILLVLGLATRLAALGLLLMTLVVELTVPDGWPIHVTWAAMALAIMAWGPGRLSLDHGIGRLGDREAFRVGDGSNAQSVPVHSFETRLCA